MDARAVVVSSLIVGVGGYVVAAALRMPPRWRLGAAALTAAAFLILVVTTGCTSATGDERESYLAQVRDRGYTAHDEMRSGGEDPSEKRCLERSQAVNTDPPAGVAPGFMREVHRTFTHACRTGR